MMMQEPIPGMIHGGGGAVVVEGIHDRSYLAQQREFWLWVQGYYIHVFVYVATLDQVI